MRTTHTYVTLPLSPAAYDEIRRKLEDAGYQHCFHEDGLVDMHGLAIEREDDSSDMKEGSGSEQPKPL